MTAALEELSTAVMLCGYRNNASDDPKTSVENGRYCPGSSTRDAGLGRLASALEAERKMFPYQPSFKGR